MDHSKFNRSLQIQGKAKLINLRYHRKEFMMRIKKFGLIGTLEKLAGERVLAEALSKAGKKEWIEKTLKRFNLIRIDPDEITFLYIHPTRGMKKEVWKRSSRSQ